MTAKVGVWCGDGEALFQITLEFGRLLTLLISVSKGKGKGYPVLVTVRWVGSGADPSVQEVSPHISK